MPADKFTVRIGSLTGNSTSRFDGTMYTTFGKPSASGTSRETKHAQYTDEASGNGDIYDIQIDQMTGDQYGHVTGVSHSHHAGPGSEVERRRVVAVKAKMKEKDMAK